MDDITARDGLLWRGDEIVDAIEADQIARKAGYRFAEDYVRALCAAPEYDANVVLFVRIERSVRDKLADESRRRAVSLNRLCVNLLKQSIASIERAKATDG